jgi:AcrR family transcriptional regulator
MSLVRPARGPRIPDHRTRTAAEKRDRMRVRLIEAALQVFAAKSADAAVIDDVIKVAGVSRGTFYNYFRTNDELMAAVLHAVGDEILGLIEVAIADHEDPAERLAHGLRMMLRTARRFPMVGRFVSRVSIDSGMQHSFGVSYMVRDVTQGSAAGRFTLADPALGVDLVMGAVREALVALTTRSNVPESYPEEFTFHVLLGLGLRRAAARRLVELPIRPVEVPPGSLLHRTQQRRRGAPLVAGDGGP